MSDPSDGAEDPGGDSTSEPDVDKAQDPRYDRFKRDYVPDAAEQVQTPPARATDGVDPRFDPRFQRGYDPQKHERMRRPGDVNNAPAAVYASSLKQPTAPVSRAPGERDGGSNAGSAGGSNGGPGEPVASNRSRDPRAGVRPDLDGRDGTAVPSASMSHESAEAGGRNPFIIALWVLGAVLVAAGLWLSIVASADPVGRLLVSAEQGDFLPRTAWSLAPVFLQAGIVTLVALVLRQALRTARRSRASAVEDSPGDGDGWSS